MANNLKHRDALLADLAFKLRKLDQREHGPSLDVIQVKFMRGPHATSKTLHTTDLIGALDVISSDLYFNESGNWADACSVKVEVI